MRLITPPLPGRVAPLEQDHHLVLRVQHPVLELHQLALQAEELREIAPARDLVGLDAVIQLELQLLVQAVDAVGAQAPRLFLVVIAACFHIRLCITRKLQTDCAKGRKIADF